MLELILLLSPVCQPEYWIKVYLRVIIMQISWNFRGLAPHF